MEQAWRSGETAGFHLASTPASAAGTRGRGKGIAGFDLVTEDEVHDEEERRAVASAASESFVEWESTVTRLDQEEHRERLRLATVSRRIAATELA